MVADTMVDGGMVRLAKGSHPRYGGSGKMCAMNLISREQGDMFITDFPSGVAPTLAVVAQW